MKTILVLEDEPPLLKLLRHMLKQYKVLEAATAEQALGLFSDHHRPINLLVADVTLPTSWGSSSPCFFALRFPTCLSF